MPAPTTMAFLGRDCSMTCIVDSVAETGLFPAEESRFLPMIWLVLCLFSTAKVQKRRCYGHTKTHLFFPSGRMSIPHPKMPKGDGVLVAIFYVVLHDESVFHLGDLLLAFALTTYFEGLSVDEEIGGF